MILSAEAIENYKAFKKAYTNEKNSLNGIDKSPEENIRDSEMTQGENKEVVKYDKNNKYSDCSDKRCGLTRTNIKFKTEL